jgi:DNA polymerase I-like protein with 3'-5' exonuclease and polymerase domains
MVRVAMQRLEPVLDHYGAEMKLQIHDSLVTEYPDDQEGVVMEHAAKEMCDFPMFALRPRVDAKSGYTFGAMAPYELREAA